MVYGAEHERGLKVLMGIMCVKLADAAGLEDENAATEELLLWTALLVAVVAAWEAIKWAGVGLRAKSTSGGGLGEYVNYRRGRKDQGVEGPAGDKGGL